MSGYDQKDYHWFKSYHRDEWFTRQKGLRGSLLSSHKKRDGGIL